MPDIRPSLYLMLDTVATPEVSPLQKAFLSQGHLSCIAVLALSAPIAWSGVSQRPSLLTLLLQVLMLTNLLQRSFWSTDLLEGDSPFELCELQVTLSLLIMCTFLFCQMLCCSVAVLTSRG